MRTGLITFHFAHHYGAQLQATCHHAGHPVPGARLRDHRLPPAPHHPHQPAFQKERRRARHGLRRPHRPPLRGVPAPLPALRGLCGRGDGPLPPGGTPAFEQLRGRPARPTDVYVAGSDQIWNPYIFQDKQFDPSFLLGFVREGRRIAYAPSLGVPELPEDKAEELRRFLTPFSACPCGKSGGRFCCGRLPGGTPGWCWTPPSSSPARTGESWLRPPNGRGPISCATLSPTPARRPPTLWPYRRARLAHRAARGGPGGRSTGRPSWSLTPAPREFLGLFRHASAVVTNSFHGAAFSLQFQKDFFTSMSPRSGRSPPSPASTACSPGWAGADRILGLDTTAPVDAPIDYGAVYEKLAVARADSCPIWGPPSRRPPARGGAGAPGRPPSGAVQGGGLHRLHRLCVGLPGERHCHGARP